MFWSVVGALGAELVGGALDDVMKDNDAERQRQMSAVQHRQQMELEERRMQTTRSNQRHETVMGILKCVDTLITVAGQNNNY